MKRIQVDVPLLPEQPERSVQLEKALPSLTRLALKIRKGVVVTEEATQGYLDEAHYLQKALVDGKIANMQFGLMVREGGREGGRNAVAHISSKHTIDQQMDVVQGKPMLLWDDVSG